MSNGISVPLTQKVQGQTHVRTGTSTSDIIKSSPGPQAVPAHIAEQVEVHDGSQAIEVSALFEDAVVEVRHLEDPARYRPSRVTRGLLGSAAVACAALLLLFIVSYVQVRDLRAKQESWEREGKSPAAFVMPREGTGRDVLAGLIFAYGLFALLYGLSRLADERRDPEFTIGTDRSATFAMPEGVLPASRFPLVRPKGGGYEVNFTLAMSGDVQLSGKSHTLLELTSSGQARPAAGLAGAFSLPLQMGTQCSLRLGENTFNVHSVPRPRHYPVPLSIDWGTQAYTGAVFAAVSLFLLLIFSLPPDPRSLSIDAFLRDSHLISVTVAPQVQEDPEWLRQHKDQPQGGGASPSRATPTRSPHASRPVTTPHNDRPVSLSQVRTNLKDLVRGQGVLKILDGTLGGGVLSAGRALSGEASDILSDVQGTEVGDVYNPSGGVLSSGRDGGGIGGPIGVGPLDTPGAGGGNKRYGIGVANFKQRTAHGPDPVVIGQVDVRGSLDKDLIRRIIRQHVNEVRFCYEKELTRNASLQGRVMIQFTIATTGLVASSIVHSSTMNNPPVEQCISGAVRRWQFPRPQNGIVIATYPFVLKSAS